MKSDFRSNFGLREVLELKMQSPHRLPHTGDKEIGIIKRDFRKHLKNKYKF